MTKQHGFKAEVQQLLELMIHSVYSDREVFLRELISNAADALDKARFLSLTRDDLTPGADEPGIYIHLDTDARTLTIEDDGVGMTEEEAIEHLGTIAKSGTRAFLEAMAGDDKEGPQLIGQFGLGFYSAFMVADKVVVESRSIEPDAAPIRWISEGKGSFTIEEGSRDRRGTAITLHLREDAKEFTERFRVQGIVRKHSNYLPWPIWMDGEGDDAEKEQINSGKALWAEPPSQVTDEEANAFYRTVAMDWRDPALRIHFSVDSPLQYSALLFVPQERPYDLFNPEVPRGPRLYARRVLIEEHARELLPDWLRFVRGVVDAADIPLNVSREMVQKTAVVQKIKKALTKRILKDLAKFAARSAERSTEADEQKEDTPSYEQFWRNFGALIKEGYYHDKHAWGELILPLLRFNTTALDAEGLISLEEYKASMPEDQDAIWYITGPSREDALRSPHLEAFKKKGWAVLLLTETVDEWFVGVLDSYEGLPFKNVARGELELEDDSDDEKADLEGLAPWMQDLLGDAVSGVRPSSRLTESPAVLVDAEEGISSNMERILRAANQDLGVGAKRILELNPRHPLIKNLAALHASDNKDEASLLARLVYDEASLLEGHVKDPAGVASRLQELMLRMSTRALGGESAADQPAS